MLNSKVFRLFWRDNLRSTRRRSASCPNLENLSQESEKQGQSSYNNNAFVSTSESESDDDATKKFVERLKVQQSIRRVHKKEKEKKENAEKKLISMDDYLGKLSELKTWLKEEQRKDVDNIKSPKLKAHFKTFVKLWNKRKLPLKYYKSCSVDLNNDDAPMSPSYTQQPINYQCSPFEESAKFSTSILHTPFNLPREESLTNVGSPFSTFGKCDPLSSPIVFTEQDCDASKCMKKREVSRQDSSPHKHKYNTDQSSQNGSPPKFATISRAVPAASLFYKFTAQPWSSGENIKARPVLAPKCPDPQNHFSASTFSSSPTVTRICSHKINEGERTDKTDGVHQTSVFTKSPAPSPVYSTTIDAIPYNKDSPKYAEIDESICSTPQKLPSSGYCSISPLQKWKPVHADMKQSVSKKQSFSRRRSKSMEDIYSLPCKAASVVKFTDFTNKEYTHSLETPPIPDRKYSPEALSTACPDQTNRKTTVHTSFEDYSRCNTSPLKVAVSPVCSPPESNMHKRHSQEGTESDHDTASLKKSKATVSSSLHLCTDSNETLLLNTSELESATTPVLSILTGSIHPTTRSKYKMGASVESLHTNITSNSAGSEARLSMIKIQQLDESPKLPRRRLKRRSSSLSTTPGKGLTLGKASKMSTASPRRVSFAKNVKEAENKATPGKFSPARHAVVQNFTRQTQDRKKFESFLSSHENLPKSKASSPEKNSPPKPSSPDKRSSQKFLGYNGAPLTIVYHEKQDNKVKKELFASKNDENQNAYSKLSTSTLNDVGEEGTPPLSSTRQVGQRVLGAPKASPDKTSAASNSAAENDYFKTSTGSLADAGSIGMFPLSSTRQVGRRVLGAPKASPDKTSAASNNAAENDYSKTSTGSLADAGNIGESSLSSTRQVGRRVIGAPKASPGKTSAALKNTERNNDYLKTSTGSLAAAVNIEMTSLSSTRPVGQRVLGAQKASSDKIGAALKNTEGNNNYLKTSTGSVVDSVNVGTSLLTSTMQGIQRVLDAPKVSSDKNIAASENAGEQNEFLHIPTKSLGETVSVGTPLLSSAVRDRQRVFGAPRVSPEKSIADGMWAHSTRKAQGGPHFSPKKCSPHVLSPPKHMEVSSSPYLPRKVIQRSPEKSSKGSLQLSPHSVLLQKNAAQSVSLDTKATLQRLSSQKHTSPQDPLRSPQKALSPSKDETRELKHLSETKRLFDLPSISSSKKSINALVCKLTEKTSTICAKELSESDDCLSSDEVYCLPTSQQKLPEYPSTRPDSMNVSPDLSSPRDELHKETEDFIITTLDSSPGEKAKETFDCNLTSSVTSGVEILSTKEPASNLENILKTAANKTVAVDENSLRMFDEVSTTLPVQEFYALGDNEKPGSESDEMYHIPQQNNSYGYSRVKEAVVSQCFTLPVNYMTLDHKTTCSPKVDHSEVTERFSLAEDSGLSNLTSACDVRKESEKDNAYMRTAEVEASQISYQVQVNNADKSSLKPTSVHSVADDNNKNEHHCDLKRLASIRASPKVVENDSWVTERRRSSRGKRQHSFRSAYNKHLLRTSSKECEEAEADQVSVSESLNLTPDVLDSSTIAPESLEVIDNTQDTLPENTSEVCNKDITSDTHGYCQNINLVSSIAENSSLSSPAKIKPATLPKPSKASLLAHRNIHTANKSAVNTGKAVSKRRSSIMKSEAINATPSRLEKSRIIPENSRTRLSTKLDKPKERLSTGQVKVNKRMSSSKNKISTRKSNGQGRCQEASEKESSVLLEDDGQKNSKDVQNIVSNEQECSRPQTHRTKKVSSNGAAGRRKSKNRNIDEENKVPSFAEKMKFFSQLRVNDVKTQKNRAFNTKCEVRCSPQKQNQSAETSVRVPSNHSEHVSLHKTEGIFLASPDKHSTDIM